MNKTVFPLHPAQRDVLMDQLINRGSPNYNVGGYIRLTGTLDHTALLAAIRSVPDVFDVFRMRFDLQGEEPFCFIPGDADEDSGYRVKELDLSTAEEPRRSAEKWMQERFDEPLALEGDKPLFELYLIKISSAEFLFFNRYHHLITDGYGFTVWAQYIAKKYSALIAGEAGNFVYPSYREEAVRSDAYYRSAEYVAESLYWQDKIREIPRRIIQPKEKGTGAGIQPGGKFTLLLSDGQSAVIKKLEQDSRSSLQHLTIAVLVLYFSQLYGESQLIFGVPIHKRRTRSSRQIVGMLSGILPFKAGYDPGMKLIGLIRTIAATAKSDYRNQQYLLGDLARHLKNDSAQGIIDIVINYELLDFELDFGKDLQAETFELTSNYSRFPLQIWWRDYGKQQPLQLEIDFSYAFFEREEIDLLAARLVNMLLRLPENLQLEIGRLDILMAAERECLLATSHGAKVHYAPGRTVVERIAEQARRTPQAIAVVAEGRQLRYEELEQRANRLGWWLRSQGVGREVPVGICLERSVEMIVSILGIWKAGGAYVPIDPEHPAERIAYVLADTGIRLVLSGEAYMAGHELAPGPRWVALDRDWEKLGLMLPGRPPGDPDGSDLAYVIYTSGSTGKPKGVMVEHRGVVNRLLWGQEYYGLGSEDAVLQKTTYCFDVSVWELLWPLMTGARLVFARPGGHKDAAYLKALIESQQITVVHFVPTMLEAFLLETGPGECRQLRRVFCSGEALKPSQVQLCKEKLPQVFLHNLYGPTEASIEVTSWTASPGPDEVIPIGKPVHNTQLYILSRVGKLCPVGTPGELYIGGVQLARGYLNRPELTAEKFVADAFTGDAGGRMYRTGDLCRWLADGHIEYLGRLDDQVKIRGYRVELGEIEAVLLSSGQVKQALVLALADGAGHRRLAGYLVAAPGYSRDSLLAYLGRQLPDYMIPTQFVELDSLPLNPSGKVDRRALMALLTAGGPGTGAVSAADHVAPRTEMEIALAEIWQDLLGVERIGVNDNFFERGGDSIITIQVVNRARRRGYTSMQVADLFQHPTIARLANAMAFRLDSVSETGEQGLLTGDCGLLPIQRWFLEKEPLAGSLFNQGILLRVEKGVQAVVLSRAVELLIGRHDALRFVYRREAQGWRQTYGGYAGGAFVEEQWQGAAKSGLITAKSGSAAAWLSELTDKYQRSLNIERGELVRVVLFRMPEEERYDRLLLVIHHLAVDGVSWRILLTELDTLVKGLLSGQAVELGSKGSSYRQWYNALEEYGQSRRLRAQLACWQERMTAYRPLPVDRNGDEQVVYHADVQEHVVSLDRQRTRQLLQEAGRVYRTEINDILLTALDAVLAAWSGAGDIVVGLEGHGREELGSRVELSRTVGWFTNLYPVLLRGGMGRDAGARIKGIKERLRRVPDRGIGYGVLKYLVRAPELQGRDPWDIVFNYLGQSDRLTQAGSWLMPAEESAGEMVSRQYRSQERIVIDSLVRGGELVIRWSYSRRHYEEATIARLADAYRRELEGLIDHCVQQGTKGVESTPSDLGLGKEIDYSELDAFLREGMIAGSREYVRRSELMDGMYRLSALQEGILFHGLYERTESYVEQLGCTIKGLDEAVFRRSWQEILNRHSILRSAFYYDVFSIPVQCVYREVLLPFEVIDLWGKDDVEQQRLIGEYAAEQRRQGFDLREAPLMRLGLLRLDAERYRMIWTFSHILLDGWSLPVLIEELLAVYAILAAGGTLPAVETDRFEEYIRYIGNSDKEREETYWRRYLSGLEGGVLLPFVNGAERNKGVGEYAEETLRLGEERTASLRRYAQRNGITVNTVMQGIWAYLIYRYTGSRHVVYGVTVSGRPGQLARVEKRVGLYINTLPLYTVVEEELMLVHWLRLIQAGQSESRQYQHTALPEIQGWVGVSGDLFDSLLVFENYPMSKALQSQRQVLELSHIGMREHSNYPLSITVSGAGEIRIQFGYNTQAVEAAYVRQLRDQLAEVISQLSSATADTFRVGDLQWLPEGERNKLLGWGGVPALVSPDAGGECCWMDRWLGQVARTPEATMIINKNMRLSYREAGFIAGRLAWYFREELGLQKGDRVVVLIDRSEWILLILLALMKSRLVYVPVDAGYPEGRIRFILEDVQPSLVITENEDGLTPRSVSLSAIRKWLEEPGTGEVTYGERDADAEDDAYIIYTSGSTGTPKGVLVQHGALGHFLQSVQAAFAADGGITMPFIASHAFDISIFQLLTPLVSGGASVIVAREELQDMESLVKILTAVNAIDTVPALFNLIVNSLAQQPVRPVYDHIKRIFIGGDVIQDELLERLREVFPAAVIAVTYGPTEGTIFCAYTEYAAGIMTRQMKGAIIGRPLGRSTIHIVDRQLNLLPAGAPGEICIGGPGVAKGYWGKEQWSRERFISDPFAPGTMLYRTGDIGCWTSEGQLEFKGRNDEQVKIRGFRVEPGEIERTLLASGEVSRAAVLAKKEQDNNKRLVAFVVAAGHFDRDSLFTWLRSRLPEYMIPALVVELDMLPLTTNGKIDKTALLHLAGKELADRDYTAPRTPLEQQLAGIWQRLLGVDRIGIHDNFFELGGHSLLVTRLASAVRKELGVRMAIRSFFQLTTIESMARFIQISRKQEERVDLEEYRAVKI